MQPTSPKNQGPYKVKYGSLIFEDVTEVSWDYSADTNEQTMIDGRTKTLPTTTTASVDVTLYAADIQTLSVIFPQFAVPAGGTMSTGEVTEKAAFDALAMSACGQTELVEDLEIIGCKVTTRLVNAKATISSIDYEDNITQNVTITFTGDPKVGEAIFQMYENDSLSEGASS